ncbi:helix-turn-helix domain-containing protein [Bacillus spizizenii]|uniref:ArsR/SmtB family transcription factor n=1 Tax=Bacillus spizizenii TaxID=96241 RepID=UPI00165C3582|nr:helix-turn-helix domain-containing protein [Bacillus spizizenii]MCY7795473.1 helix-turn-helix domain-containing protein [Bacillus spizizenii]MCY7803047.1 helix-turn-helix domain-containing protein [Bacillus spizizenii]MCY7807817.1 helix-turn-helix domain-containing protein [Bacillus spizizenii]MCY7831147.1 helix-turn-helix domain-containing protein [Bacillus spizizenii]MCY7875718.1 helix-turn-helix domain-containing protein [Bacillus spizizenii]
MSFMTTKLLDDQIRAQKCKALSDESRLAIIRTLYYSGKELSCGEVGEKCNIVKTTAFYHFKTLREDTFQTYLPSFLETL